MTMRTYEHYTCPSCSHQGHVKTSENDQPYSKPWEQVEVYALAERQLRSNEPGFPGRKYVCPKCKTDMKTRK